MGEMPPDLTLDKAWEQIKNLRNELRKRETEIMELREKLGEGGKSTPELEDLPPLDTGDAASGLEAANAPELEPLEDLPPVEASPAAPELDPLEPLPDLEENEMAPGAKTPAPSGKPVPPVPQEPEPSTTPAPAPAPVQKTTTKPISTQKPAGARIAAFFNQPPAEKAAFIERGIEILTSIVKANNSGVEIGTNLEKFKDLAKSKVGFASCLFKITTSARNLKKQEEPLEDLAKQDLLSNLMKWKSELLDTL